MLKDRERIKALFQSIRTGIIQEHAVDTNLETVRELEKVFEKNLKREFLLNFISLLNYGRYLEAIKLRKDFKRSTLKDAKDYTDEMRIVLELFNEKGEVK